ncbi:MAG: hypothetical protein CMA60_01705 [Euryarchaeota archaeon]|nr:hypothetical protein [Euryarchaeota archaeon]
MRTATFLTILMLTSVILCSPVLASAPADGSTVTVTDSVAWNGGTFDGEIIIKDGVELHWTGDVSVEQGSSIIIEEGAILHFDEANIEGQNAASTLLIYDGTEITLSEEITDTDATMTIHFSIDVPTSAQLNFTINDVRYNEVSGTSQQFNVDLTQDVNIVIEHFYSLPLGITGIELFHSNAELMSIPAEQINQQGGNVIWNQASFDIENHGTLIVDDSSLTGGNITCNGDCSIKESSLYGSSPINVLDGTHISVSETSILGSRTDEDIVLHDSATIEYLNSTGTGGYTDAWIRLLSKREVAINAPFAQIIATGIGYRGVTMDLVVDGELDDESTWKFDLGTSEQKRIVEWVDGNGFYGEESGTLKATVSTNWGDFVVDASAPKTPTSAINIVYPQLSIDKVEPEAVTADTGRTHGVMVTISNTGSIAVNPNVRCYVDDVEADTTANTANWAVEPGETKDVPISWYHYTDEAVQLTCKFFYPDVLEPVSNLISNEAGSTSGEVSWTTSEESDSFPIILYAVIIFIVVVFSVVVAIRAGSNVSKDYVAEETVLPQKASDEQEQWLDADGNPIIAND